MKIGLRLLALPSLLLSFVGCQHHPESGGSGRCGFAGMTPPVASAPSLTSAPVEVPRTREHVWRLDFVFTPRDPKDTTLTPTTFTMNVPTRSSGELTIGKNVPLGLASAANGSGPRQDIGLKVSTHLEPFATSDDMLMDVDLELSSTETNTPAPTVRKVSAHGAGVIASGKAATLVRLDDDHRQYELTVMPTKLR